MSRKPISTGTRFRILKRFNFTCQYCGAKAPEAVLHVDHIHPVAKGGTNKEDNLTVACDTCNFGKRAGLLSEDTLLSRQPRRHWNDLIAILHRRFGNVDSVFQGLLYTLLKVRRYSELKELFLMMDRREIPALFLCLCAGAWDGVESGSEILKYARESPGWPAEDLKRFAT